MSISYENQLNNWIDKEKSAVNLLNSVGTLMYDKGIEIVLFRKKILEIGVSELLNYIDYANKVVGRENDIKIAALLAQKMIDMDLSASKIDIGLLTAEYIESQSNKINDFLLNSFNVNEEFFKMFSKLDQKEIFSFLRFNLYFLAIS